MYPNAYDQSLQSCYFPIERSNRDFTNLKGGLSPSSCHAHNRTDIQTPSCKNIIHHILWISLHVFGQNVSCTVQCRIPKKQEWKTFLKYELAILAHFFVLLWIVWFLKSNFLHSENPKVNLTFYTKEIKYGKIWNFFMDHSRTFLE